MGNRGAVRMTQSPITLVVGHRGVGKTAWLRRAREYFVERGRGFVGFDLDAEIEARSGLSIPVLFAERGEAAFRALERETLNELIRSLRGGESASDGEVFIVLGAGFVGPLPEDVRCLWIRRGTDAAGRIFANRPRLNPGLSPLEEFQARFRERDERYRNWADETWLMSEGFDRPNAAERAFLLGDLRELGGALTLLPENVRSSDHWRRFVERRAGWGLRFFEIRNDLLSGEELAMAREILPAKNLLISFRRPVAETESVWSRVLAEGHPWDWALELGAAPPATWGRPTFVSAHERERDESFEQALERLSDAGGDSILKAALETKDFRELRIGHAWMMRDPAKRSFLPRSADGRWSWYRVWMGDRLPLNFLREGDGSGADQPTLMDWYHVREACRVNGKESYGGFAAILGDPVAHSLTCAEQDPFFRERGMPVLRIRIREEEGVGHASRADAFEILQSLGLRHAAVTSPLKRLAYQACRYRTTEAERFGAVNTLQWDSAVGVWRGHNTDVAGLQALIEEAWSGSLGASSTPAVIWGGGGTLALVQEALPNAVAYSARSGSPRESGSAPDVQPLAAPATVIWAVGRDPRHATPPANWRPELVIDLNYAENSPGLEYALTVGARYISGLTMFRRQAEEQRKFWGNDVGK